MIEMIADVDRQVVEYRALGNALQTLDPDVTDREVVGIRLLRDGHGPEGRYCKQYDAQKAEFKSHAVSTGVKSDGRRWGAGRPLVASADPEA